jgi:hypothetical protein
MDMNGYGQMMPWGPEMMMNARNAWDARDPSVNYAEMYPVDVRRQALVNRFPGMDGSRMNAYNNMDYDNMDYDEMDEMDDVVAPNWRADPRVAGLAAEYPDRQSRVGALQMRYPNASTANLDGSRRAAYRDQMQPTAAAVAMNPRDQYNNRRQQLAAEYPDRDSRVNALNSRFPNAASRRQELAAEYPDRESRVNALGQRFPNASNYRSNSSANPRLDAWRNYSPDERRALVAGRSGDWARVDLSQGCLCPIRR